jgi:hypothetical protein
MDYLFLHIRAFSSILALLISLCLKRERSKYINESEMRGYGRAR